MTNLGLGAELPTSTIQGRRTSEFKEVIVEATNRWKKEPKLVQVAKWMAKMDEDPHTFLKKLTEKELKFWKAHVRNKHMPYDRRCRTCVVSTGAGKMHRRLKTLFGCLWSFQKAWSRSRSSGLPVRPIWGLYCMLKLIANVSGGNGSKSDAPIAEVSGGNGSKSDAPIAEVSGGNGLKSDAPIADVSSGNGGFDAPIAEICRRKCRLVLCGNYIDNESAGDSVDLYASGTSSEDLRTALVLVGIYGWQSATSDVTGAFLLASWPPTLPKYGIMPPNDVGMAEAEA